MNEPVSAASRATLDCPFCGVYESTDRHNGSGCQSCRGFLSEGLLQALRRLPNLPELARSPAPALAPTRLATTERPGRDRIIGGHAGGQLRAAV